MPQWEYLTVYHSPAIAAYTRVDTAQDCTLADLGVAGWELVAVDRLTLYFKRPLPAAMETKYADVTLPGHAPRFIPYVDPKGPKEYGE